MGYFSPAASISKESADRDDIKRLLFDMQSMPSLGAISSFYSGAGIMDGGSYTAPNPWAISIPKTIAPAPAPVPVPYVAPVPAPAPVPTTIVASAPAPVPFGTLGGGTASGPIPTDIVDNGPSDLNVIRSVVQQQGGTSLVDLVGKILPSAANPLLSADKVVYNQDGTVAGTSDTVDHPDPTKVLAAAKSSSMYVVLGIAGVLFFLMKKK